MIPIFDTSQGCFLHTQHGQDDLLGIVSHDAKPHECTGHEAVGLELGPTVGTGVQVDSDDLPREVDRSSQAGDGVVDWPGAHCVSGYGETGNEPGVQAANDRLCLVTPCEGSRLDTGQHIVRLVLRVSSYHVPKLGPVRCLLFAPSYTLGTGEERVKADSPGAHR